MARMLGRYRTGGCGCLCPSRDCAGQGPDPRRFKRREQRGFMRSLLPEGEIEVATDIWRDCRHGCDGECEEYGEPDGACTFVCHPGRLSGVF